MEMRFGRYTGRHAGALLPTDNEAKLPTRISDDELVVACASAPRVTRIIINAITLVMYLHRSGNSIQ